MSQGKDQLLLPAMSKLFLTVVVEFLLSPSGPLYLYDLGELLKRRLVL